MQKTRIGLIGVGGIMHGVHIPGYLQDPRCEITAVCDIDPEALSKAATLLSLPEAHCFSDYHALMDSGLIDVVDIATPDVLHCPIAMEAVTHDLPFSVEKPMGMRYAEVKAVCDAAQAKGLPAVVCFSWHYNPHIRMMKRIIASGQLGKVYHLYVRCIKDSGLWVGRKLEWRFDGAQSASGVMGDLSSHMFDITRFLGQEFESVSADAGIFIKERQMLHSDLFAPVTTWDWCNVLARMESGANATFQISRTAQFESNWVQIEVFGQDGVLTFVCDAEGTRLTLRTAAGKQVLTPDDTYTAVQSQAFLHVVQGQTDGMEATLQQGKRCQAALDAAYVSVTEHRWVTLAEVESNG
ncbi:MAG: Gfo/Idh/MocA family oxidoreductase [Clostridia bacterium]